MKTCMHLVSSDLGRVQTASRDVALAHVQASGTDVDDDSITEAGSYPDGNGTIAVS